MKFIREWDELMQSTTIQLLLLLIKVGCFFIRGVVNVDLKWQLFICILPV